MAHDMLAILRTMGTSMEGQATKELSIYTHCAVVDILLVICPHFVNKALCLP